MSEWYNIPPYIFLFQIIQQMEEEVKVVEAEAVEEAAEEEVPAE